MDRGETGLVLAGPEQGHDEPPRFGVEPENEVMASGFRLQRTGEEVAETLAPFGVEALRLFGRAVVLVEIGVHLQGGGGDMAADAHEGFMAVAVVGYLGIAQMQQQVG